MIDIFFIQKLLVMFIIVLIFCGIAIWSYWAYNNKKHRGYALSPILLFVHALIFIILGLFSLVSTPIYIIWRDLIIIHGLIVLVSAGLVMSEKMEDS